MRHSSAADCRALVLFGATGDLARRMLWPSLYALHCDGLLPAGFQLVGTATSPHTDAQFVERVRESIRGSANAAIYEPADFDAWLSPLKPPTELLATPELESNLSALM